MDFLMQPINCRTLLEEVNENIMNMERLHHLVTPQLVVELPVRVVSSTDDQICAEGTVPGAVSADKPQASDHSIEQVDQKHLAGREAANKDELMVRFVAEMVFSFKEKILTILSLQEKRQHHNLMEKKCSHQFSCFKIWLL